MIALRNLYRNKIRNALTLLGIAAGVSVFVSSLSISGSFKSQMEKIVEGYGIDLIVQARDAASPVLSRIPFSDYAGLSDIEEIGAVSALVVGSIKTAWNPYFLIGGISPDEALAGKLGMVEGRHFDAGKKEAIIGELAARRLGYRAGNKIALSDNEIFSIVGIYSFGSRVLDGAVILDISDARRLLGRDNVVNLAFIHLRRGSDPRAVAEVINKRFPGLSVLRSGDFSGQVRLFRTVDLFVWAISAVSLFTCCIVVMNTLVMAISERTREIGILMAIGWSRFMIVKTVLSEAIILCLAGAVAGNILGLISLWFLAKSSSIGLGWIPVVVPPKVIVESIVMSVLLGAASSFYPAFLASRVLPVEALRHE